MKDRSAAWLRSAMLALGLLAAASAIVSYAAQFVMVDTARRITFISALEAGIPDVRALIFASLGGADEDVFPLSPAATVRLSILASGRRRRACVPRPA